MLQAAHTRAEGLQRDNLSLRSQLNMLTEQMQAAAGDGDNAGRTPEAAPDRSFASSRWVMSGSSGQSAGGEAPFSGAIGGTADSGSKSDMEKMKALRSGESVDASSQKSDNLTGDEMNMLGGEQSQKPSTYPSVAASVRDSSPMKPRNSADSAQRLNRCASRGCMQACV